MKIKLNLKVLLLVAILLIFMCVLNVNYVQATTKTVADLTQTDFDSIVPNSVDVTKTRTEYADFIINYDYENPTKDLVQEEIITKLVSLFTSNGYTLESTDCGVGNELFGMGEGNIDKEMVSIGDFETTITINFTKETNYNVADETYVKNAIKRIKFAKFEEQDAVFTMYNIGDEKNANKWTKNTYDFNKLINDSSITVKKSMGTGGIGGGTPWGMGNILYFYKNNVLYATKYVWNMGAYGTTLDNGTPVNMARLEQDDEVYKAMAKELERKGITNILGAYELTAYGTTSSNMSISFNIDSKYNEKIVNVLHKKSNNTYEILTTTVKNGKATVTVDELSPFLIAISEQQQMLGDVNNDKQINTLDAVMILQSVAKKITLNADQKVAADVNKDEKIDTLDAVRILQYVAKKITTL